MAGGVPIMKLILNRQIGKTIDGIPIWYTYGMDTESADKEICEACYPNHHTVEEFVLDRIMNGDALGSCHIEQPEQRHNQGVTILGFLLLIAVGAATLCGLLYISKKALSAARTVQANRDSQLTNDLTVEKMFPAGDFFFDSPLAVWTELTNGLWMVEIPDEDFGKAMASYREWAVMFATSVDGPWSDTGTRQWGNAEFMRGLLYDWVHYEGPHSAYGAHGTDESSVMGFYKFIPVEEVPPPITPK